MKKSQTILLLILVAIVASLYWWHFVAKHEAPRTSESSTERVIREEGR